MEKIPGDDALNQAPSQEAQPDAETLDLRQKWEAARQAYQDVFPQDLTKGPLSDEIDILLGTAGPAAITEFLEREGVRAAIKPVEIEALEARKAYFSIPQARRIVGTKF